MKKIKEILKNIDSLDTEILLASALDKSRAFLLTHTEDQVGLLPYLCFKYYYWQYLRGYSVAAIIHEKEFFGFNFYVNKNVLTPRPETELMVETAIEEIKKTIEPITLIDVGTGSGCIPVSITKNINKKIGVIAIDISPSALKVAKINAKKHQVNIKFFHGDLLSPILKISIIEPASTIIITANLPYLTNAQVISEPSIQREPIVALVAKENGLALYKKLLQQIKIYWLDKKIIALLEIDPSQTTLIKPLITEILPAAKIEIKKDLAGLDRLVKIST